jgi:hypothetical protein
MNNLVRIVCAFCLLFGLSVLFISSTRAQETTPSAADMAALQAFKDAHSLEAVPHARDASSVAAPPALPVETRQAAGYDMLDWTWIAGDALLDNNWEIVSMRPDGAGMQRLTHNSADDVHAQQTADGSRILFTSNRTGNTDLFVMNSDGANLQQLTNNPTSDNFAQWFPAGDRIVFASNRDGSWGIYTMNADGSNQTRITSAPNRSDIYPTVAPDGSKIAWIRRNGRSGEVWVMNADGTEAGAISTPCDYLENLVWKSGDKLYADCDVDNDIMNEIVSLQYVDNHTVTSFRRLTDANAALADVWMGGLFPTPNPQATDQEGFTAIQVRYVIQNQNVYLDNLWSDVSVSTTWETRTFPQAWTTVWSWIKTDWEAPVSWFNNPPPVVYGSWSGLQALSVSPEGIDTGPSGLVSFRLDYRRNGGEWTRAGILPAGEDPAGWISYDVELGDQIDLRSTALDYAGNEEDVSSKTPYSYYLYRGRVSGQITDRKGYPIAGATYTSAELLHPNGSSDADGRLADYVVRESLVGLTVTHPAFQSQTSWLDMFAVSGYEQTMHMALSPADDTLEDGGFEQKNLLDWTSEPVTATRLMQSSAYAGNQSLFLGQPAAYLANVTTLSIGDLPWYTIYQADLTYDEDGSLHILLGDLYQECIQGHCSPAENILGARRATAPEGGVVLRARAGRVVAVGKEDAGASQILRFFERRNGVWSDQVIATTTGIDFGPDLQIGPDGTLYLVWNESIPDPSNGIYRDTVRYQEQKGGVWSAVQTLYTVPEGQGIRKILARLDSSGDPHIFYAMDKLYELTRPSGGAWSQPIVVDDTLPDDFDFVFDGANTLHGIYRKAVLYYTNRVNGVWSDLEFVAENPTIYEVSPHLALLADGRLAMIRGDDSLYLRQIDGKWTGPHYVGAPSVGTVKGALLVSGPQDQLALLTLEDKGDASLSPPFVLYELTGSPSSETTGRSALTRRFVVPEQLHHPTFFFAASFESENNRKNRDRFGVEIDDGLTITHPLTVTVTGSDWQEYAISLLPWQGKEITLTLAVDAVADNTFAWARLDAMQIASWNTPLIEQVAIATVPARSGVPIGVSATVVITGENFLDGATVSFGGTPAQTVQVVSSQRIEAQTPVNLAPGMLDVTVTNPGGVSAIRPSALAVGEQVYLPVVTR